MFKILEITIKDIINRRIKDLTLPSKSCIRSEILFCMDDLINSVRGICLKELDRYGDKRG